MSPIFTVSRDDLYDYIRCPKIVAIKAYRSVTRQEKEEATSSAAPTQRTAYEIGLIGELAVELGLSPTSAIDEVQLQQNILCRLRQLDVEIDDRLRRVLDQTAEGLTAIRPVLIEEYGELKIVGKGELRYQLLPCYGSPDFVAFTSQDKPILVEVKNVATSESKRDRFQAAYYNSLQSSVGVVVKKERYEEDKEKLSPDICAERDAETIILYPRLQDHVKVTDTLDLSESVMKDLWRAKQLGLMGRAPHTDCGADCPHRRLGIELPEDNIEAAKPLPLIMAQGLLEEGADLDHRYLRSYLREKAGSLMTANYWLDLLKGEGAKRERSRLVKLLSTRFGLDEHEAALILDPETRRRESRAWHDPAQILKTMSDEAEAWQSIMTPEALNQRAAAAQGLATRIYPLPRESASYVRKSWKKWE